MVAPYSGVILETVARSVRESESTPGPKYSTKRPITCSRLNRCVIVSTRSVEVVPAGSLPTRRTPTTSGMETITGSPSAALPPSKPPTPQATTPSELTIAVWLSMPISESGHATLRPPCCSTLTTRARNSRLIW